MPEEVSKTNGEEVVEAEELSGVELVQAVDRAALDVQITTAKAYPRSVDSALKEARSLACLDEHTAKSMFYTLKRRDKDGKTKFLPGPSVRLSEVMLHTWGNIRAEADIVAEDKTHVTAMGTCFDLEKNVAVRVRVKRRIVDRHGRRYSVDMIGVTANAAISFALRNAVFKVVPRTLVDRIFRAAQTASLGEGGTIKDKRKKAVEEFEKLGAKREQIFSVLDVQGLDDIGEKELVTLWGLLTAIKDGETSVREVFSPPKTGEGTEELQDALKGEPKEEKEKPKGKRKSRAAGAKESADADTPVPSPASAKEPESKPEDAPSEGEGDVPESEDAPPVSGEEEPPPPLLDMDQCEAIRKAARDGLVKRGVKAKDAGDQAYQIVAGILPDFGVEALQFLPPEKIEEFEGKVREAVEAVEVKGEDA